MIYRELEARLEAAHLTILGGFHSTAEDNVPAACETLLLLGPRTESFWPAFKLSPEYLDGRKDPMDRWSARVIGTLAAGTGATALFPFGGPPFLPFYSWALRSGRIHRSPIQLLVHDTAGLMVSFRGALAWPERLDLPPVPPRPCDACAEEPCRTGCPVSALGATYDVEACKSFLDTDAGTDCMDLGCAARRACPVSSKTPRPAGQSAFHMRSFKG